MVNISVRIPADINQLLNKISKACEKPKSFYIRESLRTFLISKLEDLEDYEDAAKLYEEFIVLEEKTVSFSEIRKTLDL